MARLRKPMKGESKTETMSLDEVNRALDLARERDPSIEPEPGYSDGSRANPSFRLATATNLSILAAAALIKGQTPRDAVRVATALYSDVQQLARQYLRVGESQLVHESSQREKVKLSRPERSEGRPMPPSNAHLVGADKTSPKASCSRKRPAHKLPSHERSPMVRTGAARGRGTITSERETA